MAAHQFAIMNKTPKEGEIYDDYEPEKYDFIAVDDDLIQPILSEFNTVNCFSHTVDFPCNGLAYEGITLIPPDSVCGMINIIDGAGGFGDLKSLLMKAKDENKFIIHYGL